MTDHNSNSSSCSFWLVIVRSGLLGMMTITSIAMSLAGIKGINMLMRWEDGSSLSGPGGGANFVALFFVVAAAIFIVGSIINRKEPFGPWMAAGSTAFGLISLIRKEENFVNREFSPFLFSLLEY